MATSQQRPSLLVILGPTASGKSALAHSIASKYNGEIISADSRAIYKSMDIGTAKPSKKEQREIKYWGLDLVKPGVKFSAADFQRYAKGVISDIKNRDKLPIMVGGSGLYLDSVLFDYSFTPNDSQEPTNTRHRLSGSYTKNSQPIKDALMVGLWPSPDQLRANINRRIGQMFRKGVVNETNMLMLKYGKKAIKDTGGIAYLACIQYLDGELDLAGSKELAANKEYQFSRRQKTWFKRNKDIEWFENSKTAKHFISTLLNT